MTVRVLLVAAGWLMTCIAFAWFGQARARHQRELERRLTLDGVVGEAIVAEVTVTPGRRSTTSALAVFLAPGESTRYTARWKIRSDALRAPVQVGEMVRVRYSASDPRWARFDLAPHRPALGRRVLGSLLAATVLWALIGSAIILA